LIQDAHASTILKFMPSYTPSPINTDNVELPPEITALSERLAESIHDVWALERIAQGWKHGPKRDDALKEHPCLVPYDALSESEKVFDRKTASASLKSVLALGYEIKRKPAVIEPGEQRDLTAWQQALEAEAGKANKNGARGWTFDMDDGPEIASLPPGGMNVAREVLRELQDRVFPVWQAEDATALQKQARHARIAAFAIWPGILAVVCAILQLSFHHFGQAWRGVAEMFLMLEFALVMAAVAAVLIGLLSNVHHGWLAHRQRAERLRGLKFRALSWPELWCDFERWKARLAHEVGELRAVTTKAAHHWAREKDTVHPELPEVPACVVPEADLKALSALYRVKRLEFQHHYFGRQSVKADRSSWVVNTKLGLVLFFLSVVFVLMHAGHHYLHEAPAGGAAQGHGLPLFDVVTISLAALLPVIGFGFRAWLAAFEAPRSRNLYRAKALALEDYMKRSAEAAGDVGQALAHIAQGEHFFINEHREWCRLQMEAEWFV